MKKLLGLALALLVGACTSHTPPVPVPIPTPAPTPTPHTGALLHRQGTQVVNVKNEPVFFYGLAGCCEGWPENGWPWATEGYLREAAAAGVNMVHIRLGPFYQHPDGESVFALAYADAGGKADLSKIRPEWKPGLRKFMYLAESLGIQVEVDLIDYWQVKYPAIHPWAAANNVNGADYGSGYPLLEFEVTHHPFVESWLRDIVDAIGDFPNLHWQDGNELFIGSASKGYILSERAVVRDQEARRGFARHMFWSNSGREDLENELEGTPDALDGGNFHQDRAFPMNQGQRKLYTAQLPRGVNEYGGNLTPSQYLVELKRARQNGSFFILWRGAMSIEDYRASLAQIAVAKAEVGAASRRLPDVPDGAYTKPKTGRGPKAH